MRIVNTALAALLVASLSATYGLKEQTKDLEREAAALSAQEAGLRRDIARLKFEWRYATSPDRLDRLAAALFGAKGPSDAEGVRMAAWAPEQTLRLRLTKTPSAPEPVAPAPSPGALAAGPLESLDDPEDRYASPLDALIALSPPRPTTPTDDPAKIETASTPRGASE
ncbi:MAG: hypothetical protein MRY74_01920 [Neomegalonema sp.]|nr:hypothetical protein [Neomegalonema sp.]